MIVGVHQPNYIPWIGFFDKMDQSHVFVVLDTVLHSRKSVTHRNSIKSPNGSLLLSVPIQNKGQPINRLLIHNEENWKENHWKSISYNYSRCKYWELYEPLFNQIYYSNWTHLYDLNMSLIYLIRTILQIDTQIVIESELESKFGVGSTRIVNICRHLGAKTYLSGVGAKSYNDEEDFQRNGIELVYQHFIHPFYNQQWGPFISHLSILDLIFNHGPHAIEIMRQYRNYENESEAQYV